MVLPYEETNKKNEISNSDLKNGDIIVLMIKFANQILFLGIIFLLPFHY